MACAVINITIDGGGGSALAVTATLSGATAATVGKQKILASVLKSILFDALAFFESTEMDATTAKEDDESGSADRGVVPVILALEAALPLGPDTEQSTTVVPLIRSATVRKRVQAVLDRGKDYWVFDCRGTPIQDHEAVADLEQPAAVATDLRLVPLHTVTPPPFIVSSTGTRKWIDAFGKPFVSYTFQVKHAQLEWGLAKRFSEFAALHDTLKRSVKKRGDDDPLRLVAGALPPLPARWPKPSTEEGIEERRLKLEAYIQTLVAAPGAMEDPHVLGFLGIMNPRTDLPLDDPRRPGRRRQVVHLSMLHSTLRWGDIVLFRCAHVYAGLQRAVTRAEWDHVGLVVPSMAPSAGLDLLESTGEGVTRYPLMDRMKAYASEFTEAIAMRRLEGPRTQAVRQALHSFVKDVEGKPYGFLTLSNLFPSARRASTTEASAAPARRGSGALLLHRLFRRKSNASEEEGQQQQQKEGDHFFCSQLVAAGLKAMGVLPPDLNASRFWPGSFAEGGDVDEEGMLSSGWHFEEVTLVDKKTLELGSAVLTG